MRLTKNASKEKLRGGFYTPVEIVDFLLGWIFDHRKRQDILEPSCGDGIFLKRIRDKGYAFHEITAVELDQDEAKKAMSISPEQCEILNQDFHAFANSTAKKFDTVIGNPPYIRYQYFDENQQKEAAKIFRKAKTRYSKLSNAWVSFVLGSSLLLKPQGKMAFVLPAELLQVSHTKELRHFLSHFYNKVYIVSFRTLVFPNIQQEVILLMCERDGSGNHFIEHIEVDGLDELKWDNLKLPKNPSKKFNTSENKWTHYFLDQKEIDFLDDISQNFSLPKIGDLAKVEVGITTGSNDFFTVPKKIVEAYELKEFSRPMVGRSVQAKGIRFTEEDWKFNIEKQAKAFLLVFPENGKLKDYKGAQKYIRYGESREINKGYKCRIRDVWYVVPSLWTPDVFFLRRNNIFPKVLVNEVGAYTTDTMHRVSLNDGVDPYAFSASFYNSLSLAFSEICGRSHAGGVLELMPNEVESILLPYRKTNTQLVGSLDSALRAGATAEDILSLTDDVILRSGFGFNKSEIRMLYQIWKKLSSRRISRGKKV